MTVPSTVTAPPIPRPRDPGADRPRVARTAIAPVPELPPAQFPWPEPWRYSAGARPRTEYWDVTTASWHSRGPRTTDRSWSVSSPSQAQAATVTP